MAGALVSHSLPFLLDQRNLVHDGTIYNAIFGLFYDRVYVRYRWLWSATLRGGIAYGVRVEIAPISDTVDAIIHH